MTFYEQSQIDNLRRLYGSGYKTTAENERHKLEYSLGPAFQKDIDMAKAHGIRDYTQSVNWPPGKRFCYDYAKNGGDIPDDVLKVEEALNKLDADIRKNIATAIGWAVVGFIFGFLPIPKAHPGFQTACLAAVNFGMLGGLYTMYPRDVKRVLIIVGSLVIILGTLNEFGHLDWAVDALKPILIYFALWEVRPYYAALITCLLVLPFFFNRWLNQRLLSKAAQSSGKMRVRFTDGSNQTGTIDPKDFDPTIMEKL